METWGEDSKCTRKLLLPSDFFFAYEKKGNSKKQLTYIKTIPLTLLSRTAEKRTAEKRTAEKRTAEFIRQKIKVSDAE
jgi:hypothetical protein